VRHCVVLRLVRRLILRLVVVRLVPIERSTSVNYKFNQWFWRQRCRSRNTSISV